MGKKNEDGCVGCSTMGLPCLGNSCSNRNIISYFCDDCEDEFEPEALYYDDVTDEELCATCLLKKYKTVKEMNR